MRTEELILSHLIFDEAFSRKTIPYVKAEYFSEKSEKVLFQLIEHYTNKYNKMPTKEALSIDLNKVKNLDEETFTQVSSSIKSIQNETQTDPEFLIETCEEWCRNRAVYNAIIKSISIYDDKDKEHSIAAIPDLLSQAIGVNFDANIGHDYLESFKERWEHYNSNEDRIPFMLKSFNNIMGGGPTPGTLTGILGGIHVGKSLIMCSLAADHLQQGFDVLYITLELSEHQVESRIDANLLDIEMGKVKDIPFPTFSQKIQKITSKTKGKLIVKQFPTASAGAHHFRHLLHELKIKKNFRPKVIYIDYINLCISSRLKAGSGANTNTLVKSIAEELRGLMIEENIVGITATQLTRCLALNTIVETSNGKKEIQKLKKGDLVLSSNNTFNEVQIVYPIQKQKTYKIKTKSGKEIICSEKHIFPTLNGLKAIESGLKVKDKLFVKLTST